MLLLYGVAALCILTDQLTKWFAVQYLSSGDTIMVLPDIFHLTLVHNTGIAFGLFHKHPGFWIVIITASLMGLLYGITYFKKHDLLSRAAYGMILGGAFGNWIDRLRVRHVIDFLDFRIWPVFNLADTYITVGVVILLCLTLFKKPHDSKA